MDQHGFGKLPAEGSSDHVNFLPAFIQSLYYLRKNTMLLYIEIGANWQWIARSYVRVSAARGVLIGETIALIWAD